MEKENKKKALPKIDEEYLKSMMVGGIRKEGIQVPQESTKKPAQQKPVIKERGRNKKMDKTDYEKIFFRNPNSNARNGKSVYIRPEFHERLSRIARVIGEDKLTIYAYLDNVLEYHFQEFGEQITKSFNEKYKPIL